MKYVVTLLLLIVGVVTVAAQDQAKGLALSASSDAIALHYRGGWTTGNLTTESLDFIDWGKTRSNHLSLEGRELIASPTAGFSIFAGGVRVDPDLTALLKKTNVPATNFGLYMNGSVGNGIPLAGGSHMSFMLGGGVEYRVTTALKWNALQAQYLRYGNQNASIISSGLAFIFGK